MARDPNKRTLTNAELATIATALSHAAGLYRQDRENCLRTAEIEDRQGMGSAFRSLAEQFKRQSQDCETLCSLIEETIRAELVLG